MDFCHKVEEKFREVMPRMEQEAKRVIACINDEVVPEVRQGSSRALRSAAVQLSRFAEHLDSANPAAGGHN